MPRPNGQKLTQAEHEEAAHQAYELSLKGLSNREIAQALDVSTTTVSNLLKEERTRRRSERPDPTQEALSHYQAIIRHAWSRLEEINSPTSYNIPALLGKALDAQARKDAILGTEAPKKSEFQHRHLDLSKISDEDLDEYERIVARIAAQGEK